VISSTTWACKGGITRAQLHRNAKCQVGSPALMLTNIVIRAVVFRCKHADPHAVAKGVRTSMAIYRCVTAVVMRRSTSLAAPTTRFPRPAASLQQTRISVADMLSRLAGTAKHE